MNSEFRNKLFTLKNLLNVVYIGAILLLLFNPAAKALFIRALMGIGLFQPDINITTTPTSTERLPAVTFVGKDGNPLRLTDQQGKVVFITFWATWCPPCLAEMPGINQLYNRFKDSTNVVFITVNVDQQLKKSGAF